MKTLIITGLVFIVIYIGAQPIVAKASSTAALVCSYISDILVIAIMVTVFVYYTKYSRTDSFLTRIENEISDCGYYYIQSAQCGNDDFIVNVLSDLKGNGFAIESKVEIDDFDFAFIAQNRKEFFYFAEIDDLSREDVMAYIDTVVNDLTVHNLKRSGNCVVCFITDKAQDKAVALSKMITPLGKKEQIKIACAIAEPNESKCYFLGNMPTKCQQMVANYILKCDLPIPDDLKSKEKLPFQFELEEKMKNFNAKDFLNGDFYVHYGVIYLINSVSEYLDSLNNKKVAFVGMGVANVPCAKWFALHGIKVYACDKRDREYIGSEICDELENLGVNFSLGESYLDILPEMDVIFRSHGILPFQNKWIGECIERGQTVTTEMEVFFKLCPSKIIAVTGSNGKTTTTTIISEILKNSGKKVYLGGNIGKALMPELENISAEDYAAVELSSFQLLTMGNMVNKPDIAVVTNIESTHLDHHVNLDEYVDAKRNILIYQSTDSKTVLNADCDYSIGGRVYHDMRFDVRGHLYQFSVKHPVENGTYMKENGDIIYSENGGETYVMNRKDINIPGIHNVENFCTAITAVWGLASPDIIKKTAVSFKGVEHRIEFVREFNGVKYYNDSIATSPSRVISGLNSFNQKIIMICGGSDKGNDMGIMVPYILKKVKILILNGSTAQKIYNAVVSSSDYEKNSIEIIKTTTMEQALLIAREKAVKGDIVSLSPACPAFDQFKTFEYRGRKFKELVNGFKND
ncbi:MAG: UDP-N-acetylmuramoyl-L-alanine--D-glutamate ligase [Clostridiales bacterium]|nr:UDP-N-acetylmuramoyl-L-alanine--D-glutamate ligase [Clostridiales bacterium]